MLVRQLDHEIRMAARNDYTHTTPEWVLSTRTAHAFATKRPDPAYDRVQVQAPWGCVSCNAHFQGREGRRIDSKRWMTQYMMIDHARTK